MPRPVNHSDLGREKIRGLDQALYVASVFAGSSVAKSVAVLGTIGARGEIYRVVDVDGSGWVRPGPAERVCYIVTRSDPRDERRGIPVHVSGTVAR